MATVYERPIKNVEALMERLMRGTDEEAKETATFILKGLYDKLKEVAYDVSESYEIEVGGECASNLIETFSLQNVKISVAHVTGRKKLPVFEVISMAVPEEGVKRNYGTKKIKTIVIYS